MASIKTTRKNKCNILYDACVISKPSENLFNTQWLKQHGEIKQVTHESCVQDQQQVSMGRGAAWFVEFENQHWVLRHFKRGGMVAHWNKELYFGVNLSSNRAWKEWYLLNVLNSLGLSVPQPVAACMSWPYGRWTGLYKAAILINRIPHAVSLAEKCQQQKMSKELWRKVGRCIQTFHKYGVYHADLNANNILFDGDDKVYLIDFDKGEIKPDGPWKSENLNRLHRSLIKLQGLYEGFEFSKQDWQEMIDIYKA